MDNGVHTVHLLMAKTHHKLDDERLIPAGIRKHLRPGTVGHAINEATVRQHNP